MPGDPIERLLSRMQAQPSASEALTGYYTKAFGFDVPLWKQYLNFWAALFHGDLGRSIANFPTPVSELIMGALPYTLALLVPAILLSFWAGNKVGALAARRKTLDNTVLPVGYVLTATPQMWLGIVLAWVFASTLALASRSRAPTASRCSRSGRSSSRGSFLYHWILPFSALFLVAFGGWAIGMRNMIIYELEADYSNYLAALGAPTKLVRKYAYRNALLPQITGLALALGAVVAGAIVVEIVFSYPGLGTLTLTRDPEPRLLPDPGDLPLPDHRRPDREPHHRHRLRLHRPAHAGRDAGRRVMAVSAATRESSTAGRRRRRSRPGATAPAAGRRAASRARRSEFLYFALRNWKFVLGARRRARRSSCSRSSGRCSPTHAPLEFSGPTDAAAVLRVLVRDDLVRPGRLLAVRLRPARGVPRRRRRRRHRLAHRRGRRLHRRLPRRLGRRRPEHAHERRARDPDARDPDHRRRLPERAQLRDGGDPDRADVVAVGGAGGAGADLLAEDARLRRHRAAQRAQARGRSSRREIAPNMSSYLLMMFILLFGGAILIGASLDFLGLGPSTSVSLGLMMNNAFLASALLLGSWWWFVPPGVGIIAIVGGLYVMNVGLDEVFNPKLRESDDEPRASTT